MRTYPLAKLSLGEEAGYENARTTTGLDEASLRDLADSIMEHGLMHPLDVWFPAGADAAENSEEGHPSRLAVVIDGQRRVRALREYVTDPPEEVAINVIEASSLEEACVKALQTAVHKIGLSSYELADQAVRLSNAFSMSSVRIAQILNKDRSWVDRMGKAWRDASEALLDAWVGDLLTEQQIDIISALPKEEQAKVIEEALALPKKERSKVIRDKSNQTKRRGVREIQKKIAELNAFDDGSTADRQKALRWVLMEEETL